MIVHPRTTYRGIGVWREWGGLIEAVEGSTYVMLSYVRLRLVMTATWGPAARAVT